MPIVELDTLDLFLSMLEVWTVHSNQVNLNASFVRPVTQYSRLLTRFLFLGLFFSHYLFLR